MEDLEMKRLGMGSLVISVLFFSAIFLFCAAKASNAPLDALFLAPQPPAPQQPESGALSPPALTNDMVMRLVAAQLGDAVIVSKIKASQCNFDTSTDALVKLKQAGASNAVLQAMIEAGGTAAGPPPPAPSAEPAAAPAPPPEAGCADYQSCLQGGNAALKGYDWNLALSDFQAASTMDPSKPDPWAGQGFASLPLGRGSDLPAEWDNVLTRGGTLTFDVWHFATTHFEKGSFHLNAKDITFVLPNQEEAMFSAALSDLSSVKAHHPPLGGEAWSFGMKVGRHNYWFSFVPIGVECQNPIKCNGRIAFDQEGVVATYVAQAIPRLASGELAQLPPSPQPAQNSPVNSAAQPPSTPIPPATVQMGQTPDQVKAILGQPLKIQNQDGKQVYVFKDMKVIFVDGKASDVE
jgi:hypothetical protein